MLAAGSAGPRRSAVACGVGVDHGLHEATLMPLLRRRTKDEEVPKAGPYAPEWDVPARFNFTRDVVEALATDPLKPALTFVDREGIVDRRTFHELAGDAARWAHLMRTRLDRGDR